MFTETFWITVAFVVMVGGAFRPVKKAICSMLDTRSKEIVKNIDEARSMQEEAESILKDLQIEHKKAQDNAENIIAEAKKEAELILKEAEEQSSKIVQHKTDIVLQAINKHGDKIVKELKSEGINLALTYVQESLAKSLSQKDHKDIVNDNIQDLRKVIN